MSGHFERRRYFFEILRIYEKIDDNREAVADCCDGIDVCSVEAKTLAPSVLSLSANVNTLATQPRGDENQHNQPRDPRWVLLNLVLSVANYVLSYLKLNPSENPRDELRVWKRVVIRP